MATAFVIDRYYLVITFLITLGWQAGGFFIAWTLQVSLSFIQTREDTTGIDPRCPPVVR